MSASYQPGAPGLITPARTDASPLLQINVQGQTPRRQVVRIHRGPPTFPTCPSPITAFGCCAQGSHSRLTPPTMAGTAVGSDAARDGGGGGRHDAPARWPLSVACWFPARH